MRSGSGLAWPAGHRGMRSEGIGGGIASVVEGNGIDVDATDPQNPIVKAEFGAAIADVAAASAAGVSTKVAREDHAHKGIRTIVAGTGIAVSAGINPTISAGGLVYVGSVTLLAPAATISVPSLNGNAHKNYLFVGRIIPDGTGDIYVRPNGVTTDLVSTGVTTRGGADSSTDSPTLLHLGSMGTGAGGRASFEMLFHAATGFGGRDARSRHTSWRATLGLHDCQQQSMLWQEDATNLTSMEFFGTANFGIGTKIEVYRIEAAP